MRLAMWVSNMRGGLDRVNMEEEHGIIANGCLATWLILCLLGSKNGILVGHFQKCV